jgi:hypothetical protein
MRCLDTKPAFVATLSASVVALGLLFNPGAIYSQSPPSLEGLLEQVQEPRPGQTNYALQTLTKAGASIVPRLAKILGDEQSSPRIRANAALVIGSIAYHHSGRAELREAVPLLAKCLDDTNNTIGIQSAQALGAIGDLAMGAIPLLIEASASTNQSLRYCSFEALGRIGPSSREAIPYLETALKDSNDDIRTIAAQALLRINGASVQGAGSQPSPKGFLAEGVYSTVLYGTTGDVQKSISGSFLVRVEGTKWKIRTTRSDEILDYFEAGSDDMQQIYLLGSHTNCTALAVAERKDSQGVRELEKAFGRVQLGSVPHFNDAEAICILWLAYASSSYFSSRTNNHIEPVYWFGGQSFFDQKITLPGEWVLEKDSPYLPIRVVYFNDGFTRGLNGSGAPQVVPNQAPWQNGYTNAVYYVERSSEVGQRRIPSSFTLDIFRPKPTGKSSTDLLLSRAFEFTLTNTPPWDGIENFIPSIPGRTYLKDRRFAHSGIAVDLGYVVSNRWPTMSDVKNDRTLGSLVLAAGQEQKLSGAYITKRKRRVVVVLMVMSTLVFVSVLVTNTRKTKKTNRQTND